MVEEPAPSRGAEDILAETTQAYAAATTYADRGTVHQLLITSYGDHTQELAFETAFRRGDRLRFEYRENDEVMTIWSDGEHTYTKWTTVPGIDDDGPDLSSALGAAAGVSDLSSVTVPQMLGLDIYQAALTRIIIPGDAALDDIDGHVVWRITGDLVGEPVTLWIDASSHALRRIFQRVHLDRETTVPFDVERTTTYEPELDGPVTDTQLLIPDFEGRTPAPRGC